MQRLDFSPFPCLASTHLQTIGAALLFPGFAPASTQIFVTLPDGDILSCQVSHPKESARAKTVLLVHGLGGCDSSTYMIRMARKLIQNGHRVVRVNLRGSGTGKGLSKRPYNAGTSEDILNVIEALQVRASDLYLVGFSLGANLIIKLAGELGQKAQKLVNSFIGVCPPIHLRHSVRLLEESPIYHKFYLHAINKQSAHVHQKKPCSLYEYDHEITAPLWGYDGAEDYYDRCSIIHFLPHIAHKTHILFARDDPFIHLDEVALRVRSPEVSIYYTNQGGHLGFLSRQKPFFWLDQLLLQWIEH